MKIRFIGFGNMAQAIAQGLVTEKQHSIGASSPRLSNGINAQGIKTYSDNIQGIEEADLVILAVKPMQMAQVLKEILPHLKTDVCLISVAAGLSLAWLESHCQANTAIIRTMPNMGAAVGLAATPMIANRLTKNRHKQMAEAIFSSIGICSWLEREEDMDAFTALSGSGPAYVFLFMEALMDAAQGLGLNEKVVEAFTFQTLKGALKLAEDSDLTMSQLRANVTSAKGTTAAALKVLNPRLHELMQEALYAAKSRSMELGQENTNKG